MEMLVWKYQAYSNNNRDTGLPVLSLMHPKSDEDCWDAKRNQKDSSSGPFPHTDWVNGHSDHDKNKNLYTA